GQLYVDHSGGAAGVTVDFTNTTIVGAAPATLTYGIGITAIQLALTASADTVNVQSTKANALTTLFGNAGGDTFNVSSTAPAVNGNGTLTGNLAGIRGELDINSGAGTDALNVSDYGGAAGTTYILGTAGGRT